LFSNPSDPGYLRKLYHGQLSQDFSFQFPTATSMQLRAYTEKIIDGILQEQGSSWDEYAGLPPPIPDVPLLQEQSPNSFIAQELASATNIVDVQPRIQQFNEGQRELFDRLLIGIDQGPHAQEQLVFLRGSGGTGKKSY
jgi:hypothetical protein